MRRALIVGNGDVAPRRFWEAYRRSADRVIAADGGVNRLARLGLVPDDVVGDLDSARPAALARVKGRILADLDPDHTDFEKALGLAQDMGIREITAIGVTQGRLDHVLGALALAAALPARVSIRFVDDFFETVLVRRRLKFRARKGTLVSLVPLDGAKGVTTRGLRWPLRDAVLKRGTLGIHNEVVRNPVTVSIRSGSLFVMRSHHVEPHA